MHSHQPDGYICPFCDWLAGNETVYKQNGDIVYQDSNVTAFVAPKWWVSNPGSVIVIPNHHYENIYDITDESLDHVYRTVKMIATAIRNSYSGCTGTSTCQHNEPDGNQDVWHFHAHVFPRHRGDNLYRNHEDSKFVGADERAVYVEILKSYLSKEK